MYYPFNHSGFIDANEAENKFPKKILSRSLDPLITLVNNPPNSNCWMARGQLGYGRVIFEYENWHGSNIT